jgi:PAS domain S-box-containing protein
MSVHPRQHLATDEPAGAAFPGPAAARAQAPGQPQPFLSMLPAGPRERQFALAVVAASGLIFAIAAPFATRLLRPVPAFLPLYQAALVVCELMTAVLVFGQFRIHRSRALLVLAGAYLFSALMAVAHALSFPGLLAPSGLLGAGPQTTAWIYFLWHGGFPVLVIAYAVLADRARGAAIAPEPVAAAIVGAVAAAIIAACALTLVATAGHDLLPPIMQGNRDAPTKAIVATASWSLALAAIPVLWRRRPLTVLDLWLAVVMCVWVFDIALAAVLNAGRYDVGWYAGRVYGLLAGSFVLIVLLIENGRLYADLARMRESENALARRALARHTERLRILHEIDRAIVAQEPPEAMTAAVIRPLRDLLDVPLVLAGFFDAAAGEMRWLASAGGSALPASGLRHPMRLVGELAALRRGETQRLDLPARAAGAGIDAPVDWLGGSLLVVPVIAAGELIGALGLGGETADFPREQLQIAQEVAAQIAVAIAQARLREGIAEQRVFLRQVIDLDRNLIFAKDREGRFTLANQALAEAYGTTVDDLIGKTDHEFNADREEVEHFRRDDLEVMDSLKDKFVPEEKITDASGQVRWLQTVKRPIVGAHGRADMILGVATDITDRKRAEAALRRAHKMAMLAHIVTGPGGAFESWSDTLPGLIGMAPETLPRSTRAWLELIHPADQAGFRAKAIEAGASGERADVEYRLRGADGEWIHIRQAIEPLEAQAQAEAGGAVHWFCTLQDVSAQKHTEQRIRGQLEHLNLLDQITRSIGERQDLRSIFQIVVRSLEDRLPIDFGCVCLYDSAANALRVACVGARSEALAHELTMDEQATIDLDDNGLGRCVQGQLVYEPDIGQVRFPFPERLARGGMRSLVLAPLRSESRVFGVLAAARRESGAFSSVECEFLRQLSEHVALAAHQAQLHESLQQAYDELRQTQAVAMQEERLRALGQMASGIAHDINNTLSPVSLYAESLLETEKNLSGRTRSYLETIQRAVDDVAETVARMREFYRQREQQLELAPLDVNQVMQQVLDLTRVRWSDMPQQHGISIQARTELAPELPKIMGAESEIREALVNLVFNAVDAMSEGGTLTLRTRLHGGPQQPAVAIEVADEGVGMDEETRRRCLEPFFTTKGERGTGLGLAMVFGTVQRHSAELEIESMPGAGTTVRLVFAAPGVAAAESAPPEAGAASLPRLRLLLVDDDPVLLKSLRDALETDGHAILAANGGEDGIAVFRASQERGEAVDAVITDLGMPYVDGRRVAAAVKEASPATPVILLTGWGRRLAADGEIPSHVDRVLAKPPKLREVREALAQLCRRGAG